MKVRRVREYRIVISGYWYEMAWDEVMASRGLKSFDCVTFENLDTAVDYAKAVLRKYHELCGEQLEWRPFSYIGDQEQRSVEEQLGGRPADISYEVRIMTREPSFEVTDHHNSRVSVSSLRDVEWRAFKKTVAKKTRVIDGEEWEREESRVLFTEWKTSRLHDSATITVTATDRVIVG